jgi:hypothetical protein
MPTFPTSPYFQPIWADDAYHMNKFGIGKLKPMPIKNEFKNMFPGGGSDAQTYFTENARREAIARVENTKLAKLGMEGRRNTTARSQRYDRDMSRSAVPNGQFYGSPMDYSVTAGGLRGGVITSPEGQEWLARRLAERAQEFENIQTGNFSKGPPREIDLQPETNALDTLLQQVVTTFDVGSFNSAFIEVMTRLQGAFIKVGAVIDSQQLGRYARIIQKLYETIRSYNPREVQVGYLEVGSQEEKIRVVDFTRKTLEVISGIINEISRSINQPQNARELVVSQMRSRILGETEAAFSPIVPPSVSRNIAAVGDIEPSDTRLPRPPREQPSQMDYSRPSMAPAEVPGQVQPEGPYIPLEEQMRMAEAAGLGRRRYRR